MTGGDRIIVDTAKEETTRQTIILVFSLVGTAGVVYLMRKLDQPEFGRTAKMMTALAVKRFANKRAEWWQDIADKAATVYNRERA